MTEKERASCIITIELLKKLALNVHGVIDVVDEQNCRKIIEMLNGYEPHWIPCSERLPEEEKKVYWVCTDGGYQCQCRWTNINHFWTDLTTDWHWHIMDVPQYSKVVAWRELPLPYSEEPNDEMVCYEIQREDSAAEDDKRFFNALKPNKEIDRSWGIGVKVPVCPNCEAIISPMCFWKNCGDKVGWCEYCGQKIDWSGWEDE